MAPVVKALDALDHEHVLVHSGQQYDVMMDRIFFRDMELREPDHRGPALEPPLRPDAHLAGESATRERDGGRPCRRQQRDRRAPAEPRDGGETVRRPLAPQPEGGRLPPVDVPPRGERRFEGAVGTGARGIRARGPRGGPADPLPDSPADREAAARIWPRETGRGTAVVAAHRADRISRHAGPREERRPRDDGLGWPPGGELLLPRPVRHASRQHGTPGDAENRIERPRRDGSGTGPRCGPSAARRGSQLAESIRGRDDRLTGRGARGGLSGMTWPPGSSSCGRRAPRAWSLASRRRPRRWPAPGTRSMRSSGIANAHSPRKRRAMASASIAITSARPRASPI